MPILRQPLQLFSAGSDRCDPKGSKRHHWQKSKSYDKRRGGESTKGARVKIDGEVTLLERAPEEAISAARLRLRATGKDET